MLFSLCVILCTGTAKVRSPVKEVLTNVLQIPYKTVRWEATGRSGPYVPLNKQDRGNGVGHVERIGAMRNASKILIRKLLWKKLLAFVSKFSYSVRHIRKFLISALLHYLPTQKTPYRNSIFYKSG